MKITFIGVGEAFDEIPNTSILVQDKTTLLLDCGYSVPPALWRLNSDPNLIDVVSISHPHADHFFGLPAILFHMNEDGRTKDLTILYPQEFEQLIPQVIDLAYGEFKNHIAFHIIFEPINEHDVVTFDNVTLTFAKTQHARGNLAVRITNGTHTVCYSGDGQMTDGSKKLYENCDLLIHDSYHENDKPAGETQGHGSIESIIAYQQIHHIKKIAFVHLSRKVAKSVEEQYRNAYNFFPHSGDSMEL